MWSCLLHTEKKLIENEGNDHMYKILISVIFYILIGGLNEQFENDMKSILDYLCFMPDLQDKILRNFLWIILHIYRGLTHFDELNLVHGDIKSNANSFGDV